MAPTREDAYNFAKCLQKRHRIKNIFVPSSATNLLFKLLIEYFRASAGSGKLSMSHKTEDMDMIGGGSRFSQSYLWLYIFEKEKEIIKLGDGQFGFATVQVVLR